jgi:hypothetical protein
MQTIAKNTYMSAHIQTLQGYDYNIYAVINFVCVHVLCMASNLKFLDTLNIWDYIYISVAWRVFW